MLRRVLFGLAIPAMAVGAVLMSSSPSFARPRGGHGGGGYHGGGYGGYGGYGGGYHGGGYYGGGWGGYGGGYDRSWGGFGLGYGLGYLSGSWGNRGYYGYGYPSYGWGNGYYAPAYSYGGFYDATPAYGYPSTGYYTEQQPVIVQQPNTIDYSSAYSGFSGQPAQEQNTAKIDVRVPANAQVWFDNQPTRQTGSLREFVSPPLQQGQEYTYTIRARWMQNGQPVDQTRSVEVAANEQRSVDFLSQPNRNFGTQTNVAPNADFAPNANVNPNANFAPNANVNPNVAPNANVNPNGNVAPTTNPVPNTNVAPPSNGQFRQAPASRPNDTTTGARQNPVP